MYRWVCDIAGSFSGDDVARGEESSPHTKRPHADDDVVTAAQHAQVEPYWVLLAGKMDIWFIVYVWSYSQDLSIKELEKQFQKSNLLLFDVKVTIICCKPYVRLSTQIFLKTREL